MKFISKFRRLSPARRSILLEATANSSLAWVMIRLLPYRVWNRWLGHPIALADVSDELRSPKRADGQVLVDIAWAHHRLALASKGFFTCLMLGFSARAMLRRRGNSSILVLGVGRGTEAEKKNLKAHAWVVLNEFDIAGGSERHSYVPVAAYSENAAP